MNRAVKAAMRPVRNLAISIVANILGSAVLFYFIEHGTQKHQRDLSIDFMGSLYWAVTTATTTGYGDISPVTVAGRLLGMWLMLSSVALVAVATGQIAGAVANDPHLFTDEEQDELIDDTEDCIQMLISLHEHFGVPIPASVEEAHGKEDA